jgi:glutathione S-transferase
MMILRSSPPSPFGRKVKLALAILGLDRDVRIEKADPTDANDTIRKQNPIGKIPALILADGIVLYDSAVILEYLDHLAGGGKIIPQDPAARFAALTLEALCDGVLDACILLVYEGRWRPAEKHEQTWIDYPSDKVKRAFDVLEAAPPALDAIPNVGAITLAARSATRTCGSRGNGAQTIRGCCSGTMNSRGVFRPSPRRASRRDLIRRRNAKAPEHCSTGGSAL